MSQVQNWSHIVQNVENANLDKQAIQMKIRGINKRAYREQLDRQVQNKNYQLSLQNAIKKRQLEEARYLAQAEKQARIQSRQAKQQIQKHYGQQNQQLARLNKNIKTQSQQNQRRNITSFLEHPFVKLVEGQDSRMQHLRQKFIKQNEINQLQEQMRHQERQANRYREMQEKNNFVNYVQESHQKRSADREKFKNRYLRIRKTQQIDPNSLSNRQHSQQLSVEKMYVSYLNDQIKSNQQKRAKQKANVIDDKRIQQFYSNGKVEPDSSPAFLGRNPLSHERKRQLYFINKHLNTHHQRSLTSNLQLNSKTAFIPSLAYKKQQANANQLNPQVNNINYTKNNNFSINNKYYQYQHQSTNHRHYAPEKHMQTENPISEQYFNQRPQIYSQIKNTQKQMSQHSRRIKSELVQQSPSNPEKLPSISKNLAQEQRENKISETSLSKRQYLRYDVISGKHIPYYA